MDMLISTILPFRTVVVEGSTHFLAEVFKTVPGGREMEVAYFEPRTGRWALMREEIATHRLSKLCTEVIARIKELPNRGTAFEKLGDLTDAGLAAMIQNLFNEIDLDGSGEIDKYEFNEALVKLGVQLNHPNIVQIVEYFTQPNYLYIILEHIPQGVTRRLVVFTARVPLISHTGFLARVLVATATEAKDDVDGNPIAEVGADKGLFGDELPSGTEQAYHLVRQLVAEHHAFEAADGKHLRRNADVVGCAAQEL